MWCGEQLGDGDLQLCQDGQIKKMFKKIQTLDMSNISDTLLFGPRCIKYSCGTIGSELTSNAPNHECSSPTELYQFTLHLMQPLQK